MTHSWGSKFVDIVFSFIIHTENHLFVGTGIRGSNPPRKPRKSVPHEKLSHPQYNYINNNVTYSGGEYAAVSPNCTRAGSVRV